MAILKFPTDPSALRTARSASLLSRVRQLKRYRNASSVISLSSEMERAGALPILASASW